MRGVLPASKDQMNEILKTQKAREAHQFITESSHLAGDDFQLDPVELRDVSNYVKEMDTIDVLQLDPASFKYPDGLTRVLRDVEDPFSRDIANLVFQQNPANPTKLIKALDLFSKDSKNN